MKSQREEFDKAIRKRYGDHRSPPSNWVQRRRRPGDDEQHEAETQREDEDGVRVEFPYLDGNNKKEFEMLEHDDISEVDLLNGAEVLLPKGIHMQAATVLGRSKDNFGRLIGNYDSNPILDSRVYDVMFPDGTIHQYAANIIAENVLNSVDEDGRRF